MLPTRNRAQLLRQQLEAVVSQTYFEPWELLVVDNGSRDATAEVINAFTSRGPIRHVVAAEHPSASYARNRGVAEASGEFLLFVDDDDCVAPGWLSAMGAAAQGADMTRGRDCVCRLNAAGSYEIVSVSEGLQSPFGFLPSASSANSGIDASLLREVGGFRERYKRLEDTDLFWRAQLAGGQLTFVPGAILFYRARTGLREVWRQAYTDSLAIPQLYRDFRSRGMPRSHVRREVLGWAKGIRWLPDQLRSDSGREDAARDWAGRFGRLVGGAREGVWYL